MTVLSEDHAQLRHDVETIASRANAAPREIKAPADLDAIGSLVKDTNALARKADAARKSAKEPFLSAGRDVDTFFKTLTDRLERISSIFQGIANEHARKVADEARRAAQEEARRAREEEARQREIAARAEEANRAKTADKHEAKAEAAADRAQEAEATAQASAADLTRMRTSSGILSTARTEWTFEIEDFDKVALDKLRPYIKRDAIDAAIRAAIKMGVRELGGVRIFEEIKASFR